MKEQRLNKLEQQIIKKAYRSSSAAEQERVDNSILFTGNDHDELLGFYFDKFNFHRKDLNPFLTKDKIWDYLFKASCR